MRYIGLSSLRNTYPSPLNYKSGIISDIVILQGIYPQNKLSFKLKSFDNLLVVPNTSFRFILSVYDNESSQNLLKQITSDSFYRDISNSKSEANPYFINNALKSNFYVKIYAEPLIESFNKITEEERQNGVKCIFNVYFDNNGLINYTDLGKFVDWVVSSPKLNEVDTDGVIPSEQISQFETGYYNAQTGQWSNEPLNENTTTSDIPYAPIGYRGYTLYQTIVKDGKTYMWMGDFWRLLEFDGQKPPTYSYSNSNDNQQRVNLTYNPFTIPLLERPTSGLRDSLRIVSTTVGIGDNTKVIERRLASSQTNQSLRLTKSNSSLNNIPFEGVIKIPSFAPDIDLSTRPTLL